MIYNSILECVGNTPLVMLNKMFPQKDLEVMSKLEFLNPGGSVKDRPARFIIETGIKNGTIKEGTHIIESTSGNLGIALAMVSRVYNLSFTAVVDPKISPTNLKILHSLGANIDMVNEVDDEGGYLKTRIKRVKELVDETTNSLWINQYANQLNWQAHYNGAVEIIEQYNKEIDCLVAAVSTTGTVNGWAKRLREIYPNIHVVGVDAVGSVLFGTPPGPRELPGIGASRIPELFNIKTFNEVIHVNDFESSEACRELAIKEGIFAGGSSGSVLAAIKKLKIPQMRDRPYRILTIFPDRGDRYLDLVYSDEWYESVQKKDQLKKEHSRI